MKQFIDKLIDRLRELPTKGITRYKGGAFGDYEGRDYFIDKHKTIDIINQLAEEHNNGWVPVSERLPNKEEFLKDDGRFIVTDGNRRYQSIYDIYERKFKTLVVGISGCSYEEDKLIVAWQSLPAPYKKGE